MLVVAVKEVEEKEDEMHNNNREPISSNNEHR